MNPYENLKTFDPLPWVDSEWISIQILELNKWNTPPGLYWLTNDLDGSEPRLFRIGDDADLMDPDWAITDFGFLQPVKFDISGS